MSTLVSSLIPMATVWLKDQADSFHEGDFIRALNIAKTHVWRIIVANDVNGNWFGELSQFGDSGLQNYFPVIEAGVKQYDLPPNCNQVRAVNVETAGEYDMRCEPLDLNSEDWKQRAQAQYDPAAGRTIYYDIFGAAPGKLLLPSEPTKTHELILTYIRTPVAWMLKTDEIDDFPFICHDLIAEDAAAIMRFGVKDARFSQFVDGWTMRVTSVIRSMRRDETGPRYAKGMFEL